MTNDIRAAGEAIPQVMAVLDEINDLDEGSDEEEWHDLMGRYTEALINIPRLGWQIIAQQNPEVAAWMAEVDG